MIPHNEVSSGNWIQVNLDGQLVTGKVERKSAERVGVMAESEIGWFYPEDIFPIPLTEDWLFYFDFEQMNDTPENGELYYKHGPFLLQYPDKNNKNLIRLSCHGSYPREFRDGLSVHELQNHYHGMTKVFIG
jgi:hypothetical protein